MLRQKLEEVIWGSPVYEEGDRVKVEEPILEKQYLPPNHTGPGKVTGFSRALGDRSKIGYEIQLDDGPKRTVWEQNLEECEEYLEPRAEAGSR